VRRVGPRELGRRGKGRVTHPSRFDDSRCEATARLGSLHHHISSPSTTSPQGAKGPLLIASQFASGLSLGEVTVAALLQNARPRHIWPRLACKICQKNQPTSTVQYPRGYVSKSSAAHPHEGLDRMPHPILATLSPPSPLYARSGPNILIFPARPPAHPSLSLSLSHPIASSSDANVPRAHSPTLTMHTAVAQNHDGSPRSSCVRGRDPLCAGCRVK